MPQPPTFIHAEEAGLATECTVTTQAVGEHPLRQRQSVLTRRHKVHQEEVSTLGQFSQGGKVVAKEKCWTLVLVGCFDPSCLCALV